MSVIFYYELPNNTSQSANIPITMNETPLGTISHTLADNEVASITATIGWKATGRESKTKILYTIWRGAPGTGASICSFVDSNESNYDSYKVSNLAQVDADFISNQVTSYVLTARLLEPGSAAAVIGGLTFLGTVIQM